MNKVTRRQFGLFAAASFAAAACGAAAEDHGLSLVDPELRGPVKDPDKIKIPRLREEDIAAFRKSQTPTFPPRLAQPAVTERMIDGPAGPGALRVFVIDGASEGMRPAILHIHGGGYILGWPESDIANLQRIAAEQGCVIVSVDYRLAPETRFPGALEDNYAALAWLVAQATALRVDPRRIVVMGESAGGGHAAALALHVRDKNEYRLAGQVLVYPMLDDRTGSTRQPPPHLGGFVWTPEQNRLGWSALLGVPAGSATMPVGAVPARAASLAGLPPTFIGVGGLDLFLQEDIDYARRLTEAGVSTELVVAPGAYHAFQFIVPGATISARFRSAIDAAIKRFLAPPG